MGLLNKIDDESKGLVPLSLRHLFIRLRQHLENHQMLAINSIFFCVAFSILYNQISRNRELSLSFLQIYLEEVKDLFNPQEKSLNIREDLVKNLEKLVLY
jgi:hypothetical protein